jgi:hypothetical protein
MKVSLNGLGEQVVTLEAESTVKAGSLVKMTANGTVGVCAAKEPFCGVALSVRGGFAAVQLGGYVGKIPYTGTDMAVGYKTIAASTDGKVQVDTAGRVLLVTDVDTASSTCGILLG